MAEAGSDSTPLKVPRTETVPHVFSFLRGPGGCGAHCMRGGEDLAGHEIRLRTSLLFRLSGMVIDEFMRYVAILIVAAGTVRAQSPGC